MGAANRIPITWLDSVRVGVCLGVAVSFFDRVQEEEDEALSWHCASGEEGRAEMEKPHRSHESPRRLCPVLLTQEGACAHNT